MNGRVLAHLIVLVVALVASCSGTDSTPPRAERHATATAEPAIYVVNYPLQYFAERISGGSARVVFSAPSDVDPAFWVPDVETILAYQQATVILLNGAGYAKWVDRVSLPQSRVVNTSALFREDFMTSDGIAVHAHGPAGEHSHTGVAFTTWIDFSQAANQAKSVTNALAIAGIEAKSTLDANFETLASELNALDEEIMSITSLHSEVALLASHPVYDYFARRYRINLKSVLWEPDSFPGEREWLALVQLLRTHPARWMVWEGEPLQETRERLMSMGVRSVVFDPCGNRPEDQGDFLTVMKQNIENLRAVFARGE